MATFDEGTATRCRSLEDPCSQLSQTQLSPHFENSSLMLSNVLDPLRQREIIFEDSLPSITFTEGPRPVQ